MNQATLEQMLDFVDHTREKRTKFAKQILANPKQVAILLDIMLLEKKDISTRASWALEFTIREDCNIILPYIDKFIAVLPHITIEQSIRPIAKICEILSLEYFSKTTTKTQETLTAKHLNKIAEASFDWLISNCKVAPKAYSITSLFNIGKVEDWIHPELKIILEQNYKSESVAYQARARKTLEAIKKWEHKHS